MKLKLAAIQAEPAWWNLQASVSKVLSLIRSASENGAQIIGFPESFIPGYPMAIWTNGFDGGFLTEFKKNCLSVKSREFREICEGVGKAGIWVVLGFTELDGGSTYCAQVIINPLGVPVLHRRKLKATGNERTIWGDAPADSLISAIPGPEGVVIGALNCWEHLQPLLRFHHYSLGVQVHVASWPFCDSEANGGKAPLSADMQIVVNRMVALEGGMFVISSTSIIRKESFGVCRLENAGHLAPAHGGGFAAIYAPDGSQLTPTTDPGEETILYADVDLDAIHSAKIVADPVGHYSRPDLLSLNVSMKPNPLVLYKGVEDYSLLGKLRGADSESELSESK